jgi:hypothetical protein
MLETLFLRQTVPQPVSFAFFENTRANSRLLAGCPAADTDKDPAQTY